MVVREDFLEEEEVTSKPHNEASLAVTGQEKEKKQKERDHFGGFQDCIIILIVLGQIFSASADPFLPLNSKYY